MKGSKRKQKPKPLHPDGRLPFEANRANRLQLKYGLKASTIRNWKLRGYIPAKYNNSRFKEPQRASNKELKRFERIMSIPFLVSSQLGVAKHRYKDYKRGKTHARIRSDEVAQMDKAVAKIIKALQQFIENPSERTLKKLSTKEQIHSSEIIQDEYTRKRLKNELPIKKEELQKIYKTITRYHKKLLAASAKN